MHRFRLLLLAAPFVAGCTVLPPQDDADASTEPIFKAPGTVSGAGGGGVLAVVWSVTTESPDYAYRFGKAESLGGTSFVASFTSEPPDEALNADGIGVGFVALFPLGTVLADGKLDADLVPLGFTSQHAIIYKKPEAKSERWWIGQFPEGFSCGACAAPPAGETFEGYKPAACSLSLVINPSDSCNWT